MQYNDHIYKEIAAYIFKFTGIHYAEANFYQLDARIHKLMKFLETDRELDVLNCIRGTVDPDAHQMLLDLATNNETYFFRDPVVFTEIRRNIVPMIKEKLARGEKVEIWSAASSSGQEIYSLMMALEEESPGLIDGNIEFHASDISSQILEKAKSGVYTQLEIQRGLPIMLLSKYFKPAEDKSWTINPKFSSKVKFKSFNLLTGSYPSKKYDLVLCRNVLIYQKKENKAKILEEIHSSLKEDGFLILGNTENTYGLTDKYHSAKLENVNFYLASEKDEKIAA